MNEFKVKKGLIVQGSGSTILDIQGSQGQLFSVTDSLSGSLFSVNDISGIPIMEVFSDNRVNLGTFNAEAIKVSGSFATMTGSLFGTASFASTSSFTTAVSGTTNYVSKFTGTNTLGNSQIFDNGTNIGIGTTSPSNALHISGTNKSILVENQGGATIGMTLKSTRSGWFQSINIFGGTNIANGQQMQFGQYDDGKMFFFNSGNFPIGFYTNGTEKLSITALGNIGIGTTTPSARLDVRAQGALATDIAFRVRNSTDTANFLVVNGAGDVYNNGAGGINSNTFFGENVGRNTTGGNNTAIGRSALESNTTGYSNTAIGLNALLNNTTGYYNTAIGISALLNNTTGYYNTAIGRGALFSNTTGGFNTAIGLGALLNNTTGYYNTAIGISALESNTTGGDNTAIGREAGNLISDGSNNTITNNSIFIGVDTRALADNQINQIVIGNGAIGLGSNSVVLGNESIVTTALRGNVGIGTTAPSTLLDVNGIITAIGGNSTQWNSKQEALVSGTNIKTLNGNNVLGSGDLSTKGIHTLVKPAVGETTSFLLYGQTIGNVVGQANRLIAVPYIPATTITCSSLYINISTALAGSNARILIYSDDNGKPGTKIYESANLDCSTTGIKTATTTQTFNAGTIYWICSHSSSTQTFSPANPAALIPINVSGISVFTSYFITPTFGSAPTTFGTGTFSQLALPFIGIKI